jgi:hypothetical protein
VQRIGDAPAVHPIGDLTHESTGRYHLDIDCPAAGKYTARAVAGGAIIAAAELHWRVHASAIIPA